MPVERAPIKIEEEDASPTGFPRILKVTNGSLTDNGDGSFSLDVSGTGGADADAQIIAYLGL